MFRSLKLRKKSSCFPLLFIFLLIKLLFPRGHAIISYVNSTLMHCVLDEPNFTTGHFLIGGKYCRWWKIWRWGSAVHNIWRTYTLDVHREYCVNDFYCSHKFSSHSEIWILLDETFLLQSLLELCPMKILQFLLWVTRLSLSGRSQITFCQLTFECQRNIILKEWINRTWWWILQTVVHPWHVCWNFNDCLIRKSEFGWCNGVKPILKRRIKRRESNSYRWWIIIFTWQKTMKIVTWWDKGSNEKWEVEMSLVRLAVLSCTAADSV